MGSQELWHWDTKTDTKLRVPNLRPASRYLMGSQKLWHWGNKTDTILRVLNFSSASRYLMGSQKLWHWGNKTDTKLRVPNFCSASRYLMVSPKQLGRDIKIKTLTYPSRMFVRSLGSELDKSCWSYPPSTSTSHRRPSPLLSCQTSWILTCIL